MGDIVSETKEEQTLSELVNIQLNSKPITNELLERTKLMIELCEEVLREENGLNCFLNSVIHNPFQLRVNICLSFFRYQMQWTLTLLWSYPVTFQVSVCIPRTNYLLLRAKL